jgi:dipeptidyl aminopeptidase/acylaminoacyl peptidase
MQLFSAYRARFANDIIAEFMPPARLASKKVAILAAGCPGYPGGKTELMHLLARNGFWSFVPMYRGSWESRGEFLAVSPHEDLIDVMDGIEKGFYELWGGTEYQVQDAQFYLIGGSFGGAAALLASRDPRVRKAVSLSGVVDWREQENTLEPLTLMSEYLPSAFGMGYRTHPDAWKRLSKGDFYNPILAKDELDPKKLLFIHAKDDRVVHAHPARALAEEIGATYVELTRGGHMGVGSAKKPHIWKRIKKHFDSRN